MDKRAAKVHRRELKRKSRRESLHTRQGGVFRSPPNLNARPERPSGHPALLPDRPIEAGAVYTLGVYDDEVYYCPECGNRCHFVPDE